MITATASTSNSSVADFSVGQLNLPVGAVNLYGSAADSTDGGATFSWQWTLLKKPAGSNASLSDANAQNPQLLNVDVWGNYRLFLVATNTATMETSATDVILAPNSAFTHVRVLSEHFALQKPAAGERDWNTIAGHWVDKLELVGIAVGDGAGIPVSVEGGATTTVPISGDLTFNVNATAGETSVTSSVVGDMLNLQIGLAENVTVQGNLAVNGSITGDVTLQHSLTVGGNIETDNNITSNGSLYGADLIVGNSITTETTSLVLGVDSVKVYYNMVEKEVLTTALLPNIPVILTANAEHTYHRVAGANNATVDDGIGLFQVTDVNSKMVCYITNHSADTLTITKAYASLADCGKLGAGEEYTFSLLRAADTAALVTNDLDIIPVGEAPDGADMDITHVRQDGHAAMYSTPTLNITFAPGETLGIQVQSVPQYLGHFLTFTLSGYRAIGG